ncbi:hypothetical protein ABL78_6990 [Leptomonas seymouri]|uniref:Uncharacterized protein n=1 Tax=Leptomonas seymouri TaxID=5684 RepID=A0A0N0P3C3_LEPSE|nr:hypothetical protein ABL78_6990 [Leptomonas seymouri]|eukprot:KPI83959.1 hypothetical protein ABL78_6990 [Leptomonas seymouri]
MSDSPKAVNELPVTSDVVVKMEKESVDATVANVTDTNGDVSNEITGRDAKGGLSQDAGGNTMSVGTTTDDTNCARGLSASADPILPASENIQLSSRDGVQANSETGDADASVGTKNKLNDTESKKAEESNVEAPKNDDTKENSPAEMKKEGTTEEAKGKLQSPNTLRKQKAAFNVDAKPFSPGTLADPAIQGTLVEANGISIKVGQWGNQPFVTMPHISPTAPVNVVQVPYSVPSAMQSAPVRKEGAVVKESLSAFAKPWSPHPEVTVPTIPPPENEVAIHPGSWVTINVEGKDMQAPSPMVPKETTNNSYAHSYCVHPKGLKTVELELFNYVCGRCPLKTLYGRLSSRQPDVTIRNVVMDIPPLRIAHLIEQITKAKVTALCANEADGTHYDIWLDKPNMAPVLVDSISGCVWTCPMYHGYAVLGKGEEGKKYLRNYVERLNDSRPEGSNVYEVALVEVEH